VVAPHFFRREYGRLVAILARRVGVRHLAAVEDAVQAALEVAVTTWPRDGEPAEPGAWLYTVAHRRLLQELRQVRARARLIDAAPAGGGDEAAPVFYADEIDDDLLRMLFVCCDDAIPFESSLVLALKTLCGFSTAEIALRLFTSRANVQKRLERGRDRLRSLGVVAPELGEQRARLPAVHTVLYLLFNEGYLSAREEQAIRRELCDEAIRLTTMLAEHPAGAVPETFALLALMWFHVARLNARDGAGGLVLLADQDRTRWDHDAIARGTTWLARSASGDVFSRFHAEAGIAAAHCLAPSFAATPWRAIVELYTLLEQLVPSPLHALNRAVAVAEWRGPDAGLAALVGVAPPPGLAGSYLWHAVQADLHGRAGHATIAERHRRKALRAAPTGAIRRLLASRLDGGSRCDPTDG
jgi:RNA polymerase sigma factor (sigma-70 family)